MYALVLALAAAAPPAPADLPFIAVNAEGERAPAKLVKLTPEFTATLATRTGEIAVKDVISLRRSGRSLPPFPTGPQLITANGERIVGELLSGGDKAFRFVPGAIGKDDEPWRVPLSAAAAIWFTEMPADTPPDPARYSWLEGSKNRDVLRFRNGDVARGILVGPGPEAARPALQFRPEMGEARTIDAKELAAIAFNPILAKPRKPKGPYARVVLADGSRVDVTNPAITDGVLTGEAFFGHKIELPLDVVVALDVFQGKAVYLSDVKPKKAEQAGFLSVTWPWAADRAVNGKPLKLLGVSGESTFDKGLGTHPRSVLSYDLGGKYKRFEALVGLDPETGVRGEVKVRVLVDGKEYPVSRVAGKPLTAGDAVVVRIDVKDAKELVLLVDFGNGGGVEANVNWADARLVSE